MTRTIVAHRTDEPPANTDEIEALADAAGYDVVGAVTQVRAEDPGTHLGRGKVADLATLVEERDASLVIVDGDLTPSQTHQLTDLLPVGTEVSDRYRLVLEIFAEGAPTERARLQVELARLRYDLPRLRENAEEGMLNTRTERGSPVYDVEDRIARIERKLDALPDPAERFRERRREEGFDLVTVAGYTNAGKSTLLRRLGDDLSLDEDAGERRADPVDRSASASVADRLFETLETTTRRATLDGRPTLVTDTVGYVADLPHWLVESFGETLSEAAAADAVVLVADGSDPPEEVREKLEVSLSVLDAQGVADERIVTAVNKVDLLGPGERDDRLALVRDVAPDPVVPISVTAGTNLDALVDAVRATLPTVRLRLSLPTGDAAMSVVSEAYDRLDVEDVTYADERTRVVATGAPRAADRFRGLVPEGAAVEVERG